MKLFAQIRKVDEQNRLVFGRAAEEVVDKADEIMDYMQSKPHFQKWSADVAADTGGKSLGNLRAMHGKVAAGKLTEIKFNDAEKAVDVVAKVVDENEWKKVLEGVYTGFSIGGSYVGSPTMHKIDGRDVKRYVAAPNELSLVDRPCIPTARFFEVQKADGAVQKVDFVHQPDTEEAEAGTVQGTPEQVDQLVKMMAANGLTMDDLVGKALPAFLANKGKKDDDAPAADGEEKDDADAGTEAAESAKEKAAETHMDKTVTPGALRKGMYDCGPFSGVLTGLINLRKSAAYEAYLEGDNSPIPAKLSAAIAIVGDCFKMLIDEMISEDKAGTEAPGYPEAVMLSEQAGELQKLDARVTAISDDPLIALVKLMTDGDEKRLEKMRTLVAPAQAALQPEAIEKLLSDRIAPLVKSLADAESQIKKLAAQPAPARVALRAVSKDDEAGTVQKREETPIVDAHGERHEAASLIKSLHQTGGAPMAMHLTKSA